MALAVACVLLFLAVQCMGGTVVHGLHLLPAWWRDWTFRGPADTEAGQQPGLVSGDGLSVHPQWPFPSGGAAALRGASPQGTSAHACHAHTAAAALALQSP